MAASEPTEVFSWLKTLPLAPEYHPTVAEFQDPISYIFKIEKEASKYGICKIIPPVPPPPKKSALANLNRSLAARNNGGGSGSGSEARVSAPTFTTRQQQIGFCPRRPRPAQRPVWQSGERYTVQEFEAKAKSFERGFLRKCAKKGGGFSPLEIESMYWKATIDKPFSVEYANDMPGSAFVPVGSGGGVGGKRNGVGGGRGEAGEGVNLGETAWNMRAVSRAKGSLLRFMKEEIPGVTSPMVYLAMLFSWFAWHVEDHDLHSLNYLHMGASKTWYGVPREAAVAFEEVVRVYGYNGEINPLVTFSVLGEKTTVMSPEVLVRAGVPCCRLVQNAGEFVVTFPRAYHTGFSHGFNCAEAANIATPEWLMVAKDAAIRRASINYPPMVSHFQLLYDLALELHSRIPVSISAEPRSSRLKDKKKGEGETVVKELFVQSVLENNDLLHALGKGSPIVLLPKSSADMSLCSKFRVGSQSRFTHSFPLASCNSGESISSRSLISDDLMVDEKQEDDKVKGFYSMKGKLASLCEGSWVPSFRGNKVTSALTSKTSNMSVEGENVMDKDGLSDHRLFSCVTCGILSFACVAIIKPREAAARYLMSADCSFLNDWVVNAGVASNVFSISNGDPTDSKQNTSGGWRDNGAPFGVHDTPVRSTNYQVQMEEQNNGIVSNTETNKSSSALGLLALNYGNSSDSEEDLVQEDHTVDDQEINCTNCSSERKYQCGSSSPSLQNCRGDAAGIDGCSLPEINSGHEPAFQNADFSMGYGRSRDTVKNNHQNFDCSDDLVTINSASAKLNGLVGKSSDSMKVSHTCSPDTMKVSHTCSPDTYDAEATKFCKSITPTKNENVPFVPSCDDDSSRMHVFCLEHAVEVEQQLRGIGGVHIQLLCHPDYPKIEAEAKAMAEELGINNLWSDVTFRDATKDDEEMIQSALDSEDALPKNGDWAVKLGINLFYSANLSRSPLYSKQMPYNSVIYNAFGRISPASSSARSDGFGRRSSRQKKVVAGKWCGKVWMSNQVHPFLAKRDPEDEEDEEEEERSFHARALPDERPERKNCKSTITKKYARKRKMAVEDESTKKVKHVKKEDEVSDDSMDDDAREQRRRSLRSKHAMCLEAQSTQKARNAEAEDAASDDSMGVRTHKQQKSILRNKKTSYVETDDMVSDDSLGGGFHRLHKQILRSKQAKHARREDVVSDDSLDNNSHRVRVRIPKSNQAKRTEQKDPAADDSLDVDSHQLLRNISKSQLAKFMEKEDSASEDFRGDNLRKSYRKTYKSKQAKSIEREDEVLDEPVEDDARQVSKRALRSKQTKSAMQQKIKQEPRQVKQAASRSVKRGTHQLVKQETQRLKQQTSRIRNNQCEPNDSDSSAEEEPDGGPSSRLRKRAAKPQKTNGARRKEQQQTGKKKTKSASVVKAQAGRTEATLKDEEAEFVCDIEGCTMGFATKQELALHKKNICPVKGCGKKFFSHKYLVQHRRVHMDDRPLRCPWKGCKMTFKWAWARTEHIRVHTGARPYICAEPGCGQTFRFVSDFSRHKRKTGHSVKKGR